MPNGPLCLSFWIVFLQNLRTIVTGKDLFSIPTGIINLCGKFWIQKFYHYGGQAQCEQMEQFSAMATRNYNFVSLNDKSKQNDIYKIKIDIYKCMIENINLGIQFYCKENYKKHQQFWKIIRSEILF